MKYIGSNTSIASLKSACKALIEDVEFAHKNAAAYWTQNFATESAKDIFDFSAGIVTGLALKYLSINDGGVTPYVPGVSEGMKIIKAGQFISDAIINAGGVSKDVLTISSYAALEEELRNCIEKAENVYFNDGRTVENASKLIALADFYKATLLGGCDATNSLMKNTKKGDRSLKLITGNWDAVVKGFTKDNDYDKNIQSVNNIKSYISSEDFYSTNGTDISAYISRIESTNASEWAKTYVNKAISYGFVPDYLQGNYQNNITRAEFCTLLTLFIETYTNETIYTLMEQAPYNQGMFKDTYYANVYYISRLGLISGVSDTEFNPLGEITREQAATLLMRTAEYLGIDTSAPSIASDDVSSWEKDGVNFVVAKGIMTGTDEGFSPQGKYTKEQVLTSFVRFYENLKYVS